MTTLPDLTFYQSLDTDLIPVAIQHWKSLEVLMLGTMSRESLTLTLQNNIVYFFALSRKEIWLKGEKSGIHIKVKELGYYTTIEIKVIELDLLDLAL